MLIDYERMLNENEICTMLRCDIYRGAVYTTSPLFIYKLGRTPSGDVFAFLAPAVAGGASKGGGFSGTGTSGGEATSLTGGVCWLHFSFVLGWKERNSGLILSSIQYLPGAL